MKTSPSYFCFTAITLLFVGGCGADAGNDPSALDDEPIGTAEQAAKIIPPGGDNGDTGHCLWRPKTLSAYSALASVALSEFPIFDYNQLATDCRQEVLANVIECALPATATVVDPFDGHPYQGHWGLAPQWATGPLDAAGRKWVTGCVIQRLNAYGVHVPILLEGANPAIAYNPPFDAQYPFDESTAWGDLFAKTLIGPPPVYVCWDQDLSNLCTITSPHSPAWWLNLRICDSSPNCGLHLMGPCAQACTMGGDANPYWSCKNPNGTTAAETVHVQLLPHTSCTFPTQ